MAKYGLETETTVHLKGMQVGGSQPDTGGGNYVIINDKNARIGVMEEYGFLYYILDTDDFAAVTCKGRALSACRTALEQLELLSFYGLNISDFVGQLGNPAVTVDFYERWVDAYDPDLADTICISDIEFPKDGMYAISSLRFLVYSRALAARLNPGHPPD